MVYGGLYFICFGVIPGHEVEGQRDFNYVPNYYNEPEYNCTIPRTVQGEWYSREKNLDTVTIIDATSMQHRGVCMQHKYDYGSNYTFLFGENPGKARTCYHCVLIFVRTVNIIEKIESKLPCWLFLDSTRYEVENHIIDANDILPST